MENQLFGNIETGVFGSGVSSANTKFIQLLLKRLTNALDSASAFYWEPSPKPSFWKTLFPAVCSLNPKQSGFAMNTL